MNAVEATRAVVAAVEACGIAYLITGSLASSAYGIPRTSKDADLVLEMGGRDPKEIMQRLGPGFELDPQMSFESITGSMRWIVHVPEVPFDIELFLLSQDAHHRERFLRRVSLHHPILGRTVFLPAPEDVVIQKIRWGRDKDRSDARDVIAVSGELLDWPYVEAWCDRHGTRALLEELRASIPPID